MSDQTITDQSIATAPRGTGPRPIWVERRGRGRLGGSGMALAIIQRARAAGRRVKPLDADFKSRTLTTYYPARDGGGCLIVDGVSSPDARDITGFKDWLTAELNAAIEDGVSRVLDVSGGSSDIDELMVDLNLPDFCNAFGIRLLSVCMLGPDREDFGHLLDAVAFKSMHPKNLLMVFNEGVLRGGNAKTAFGEILNSPEFLKLIKDGAKAMFMERLPCMTALREKGDNFYDVAVGKLRLDGTMPIPTHQHMAGVWIKQIESEIDRLHLGDRLP